MKTGLTELFWKSSKVFLQAFYVILIDLRIWISKEFESQLSVSYCLWLTSTQHGHLDRLCLLLWKKGITHQKHFKSTLVAKKFKWIKSPLKWGIGLFFSEDRVQWILDNSCSITNVLNFKVLLLLLLLSFILLSGFTRSENYTLIPINYF